MTLIHPCCLPVGFLFLGKLIASPYNIKNYPNSASLPLNVFDNPERIASGWGPAAEMYSTVDSNRKLTVQLTPQGIVDT